MSKQKIFSLVAVAAIVGTVVSPLIASAATDESVVTANVGSVLSISSADTATISVTPDGDGEIGTANDTVTVNSNAPAGYDVTIASSDSTNAMTRTGGGSLAATSSTALDLNSWGYSLDAGTTYAGVPVTGAATNISSPAGPSTGVGDVLTVTYGVNVDTSVPTGMYTESVTYTATAKP